MGDLDQRLLAAHAKGDITALVALYAEAADQTSDRDAEKFYLTQAYIYALDCGDDAAPALRARLVRLGAEPASAV
ncbi:MAG: hypothetical protein HRU31_00900 [Rhodobacteraceae bacterium]|nr:hypothetical protein [Paracoccaceae bacterium]